MSNLVSGTVQEVMQRGKATNIKLDDGKIYGCGFEGVPCSEGDFVSFATYQNGKYINADVKTMEVTKGGGQQQQQQANPQSNSGGGVSKDDYWKRREANDEAKQKVIEWQAARNTAVQVVDVAERAGALPLPQKKDEKFDALVDVVENLARRYYDECAQIRDGNVPGQSAVPVEEAGSDDNGSTFE